MAPQPDGRIDLLVFGPLRLQRDGQPLALGTRKVQALLLLLALDGGSTRERLCALLWPALDEPAARRNLRRELARVREAGAAEAIAVVGDHLRPGPALHCDLLQAEAALARGEHAAALAAGAGELAEGLHLEDAPGFAPWLAAARERGQRLCLRALEAAAAADEDHGDAAGALARVQALLALDGLQERHHRTAMRLQAAAGQREAALRQFERCRALLADELGLQPMPETVALAQSLRDDPAPVALSPLPAAGTWLAELPFVGREAEVARLQRAWSAGRAVVLVGEAGVGKTRLATDFAAAQGPYALVRCQAGDPELAFGAFARALRVLAGQPPDLRGLEAWIVTELARLLPELGPAPPPLRGEGERLRFDEACIQAWLALSRGAFDAIVLDDWQLSDAGSHTLLARAAARRREAGLGGAVEIVAWRGAADEPALQAQAEALAAEVLGLGPLPPVAVYDLVRQLSGAADPARFAQRLSGATGGHPYFIAETLRDLAERSLLARDAQGRWATPFDAQTADYRELPLAASVRDAVLARVQRLSPAAARLLEAAALAGEPFGAAWLASACALSELEALQALEQAAGARLVQAYDSNSDAGGGGYGWVHDLARQALDSALAPTRRRLVHHRLALAAEALGDVAAAARHFEACGEPARAAAHRLAAGDAAHALQALAEAVAHWRQGLADRPAPADEAALLGRLCETGWALGQGDEARAHHERLQTLLGAAALAPAARIDAQLRASRYLVHSGRSDEAMVLLESMPPPEAAALHQRWRVARMGALEQCGRLDEALADGQRALQAAPAGSRERADVHATLSIIERQRGQIAAGAVHAEASLALYTRLGDGIGRARGLFYRGCCYTELGDSTAGEADLRASAGLAGDFGYVFLQRMALYNLATIFSNQTRPDETLAVAREAWPAQAEAPRDELTLMFRTLFIECHYVRGEWGALWGHLQPAVDDVLASAQPLTMIGVANAVLEPAAVLGQWPRVLPLLQALDAGILDTMPIAEEVMLACAQAALIQNDPVAATRWLGRVRPAAAQEHARVRCRLALLQAQARQACGAGAEALNDLPAEDAPGMSAELRLRALALHCAADPTPARLQRAREALADPQAHAGAALQLGRVLGGPALAAQVERQAASLADWPDVQASFRATWRP